MGATGRDSKCGLLSHWVQDLMICVLWMFHIPACRHAAPTIASQLPPSVPDCTIHACMVSR